MFMRKLSLPVKYCQFLWSMGIVVCSSVTAADLSTEWQPGLGRVASTADIAQWDTSVFPDGTGLPAGSGSVETGRKLYANLCSGCHGAGGEGALAEELAGGEGTLTDRYPDKTIGLYWPYATTLFDVIRRSMPLQAPGSLSNDQSYALTAFLLNLNGVVSDETRLDRDALIAIEMPNRNGFDQLHPVQ